MKKTSESLKEIDMGNADGLFKGSPIRIRRATDDTWTLRADGLPGLVRCDMRLVWRYAGEEAWRDDRGPLPPLEAGGTAGGASVVGPAEIAIAAQRLAGGWELAGRLTNTSARPIELARFHYLDGAIEDEAAVSMFLLLQQPLGTQYDFPAGQEAPPIREPRHDLKYFWDVPPQDKRLPDPIYDEPNWICGMDSAVVRRGPDRAGWVLGATGPGIAFGEFGLRTAGPDAGHFFAGQLLDNILLDPGETRELERVLMLAGDWQDGLRAWARQCAAAMGASRPRPPLTGFCSWYHDFAGFTTEFIDQAIEQYAELPTPPGGRMIQVDDGFQRAPGDWRPNDRFPPEWWNSLPDRIAATGSIPSLWLAPLTVQDTNPIVREHPEWFQRLPDGRFAVTMMNWGWCDDPSWKFAEPGGHLSYNLDPDHPEARAFVGRILRDAVRAGWRAFKFDFNGFACARLAHDRRKTVFETLRDEYRLFRETLGPDVLINACVGGPWRYTVGLADSQRIGGDTIGSWECIRKLLPVLLVRMAAFNGIWWAADPDVFYMRHVNTTITGTYFDPVPLSTSEEEQSMLLTAIGVMGGMLYTSDLPSEWTDAARRKVLAFWEGDGPAAPERPRLVFDPRTHLPIACKVERVVADRWQAQCALFNWADAQAEVTVALAELGVDPYAVETLIPSPDGIALRNGALRSKQPPHSARVARLALQN